MDVSKGLALAGMVSVCVGVAGCGGGGGGGSGSGASSAPQSYTIGGTVSGLAGTGLVLRNNGGNDLTVSANGSFSFSTPVASGAAYAVTVQTQPTATPRQTCSVTGGSGTVGSAAVTAVAVSCRNMVGRYIYVPNRQSGTISAFSIDASTGALAPVAGSPFSGAGPQPGFALPNPAGTLLYVAGNNLPASASGTLNGYTINATTGALTAAAGAQLVFPTEVPGLPTISAAGDQLLVGANAGSSANGHLYAYNINGTTGALTPLTGSPLTTGTSRTPVVNAAGTMAYVPTTVSAPASAGSINAYSLTSTTIAALGTVPTSSVNPIGIVLHSSGSYLYVAGLTSNVVEAFSISAGTGLPAPVSGSPYSVGQGPTALRLHSNGQFLYVNNSGTIFGPTQTFTPGSVSAFAISANNGALTPVAGSPFASGGANASGPVADPTWKYLTVTNGVGGNVAIYGVSSTTGALTLLGGAPTAPAVGTTPGVVSFDPSGRYAYLTDGSTNSISAYSINPATDTLTFIASYPTGVGPVFGTIVGLQ